MFLKKQRAINKRPCKPEEIYCVKCRKTQVPAENMADFIPVNENTGRLIALCPECNCMMNKFVSKEKIVLLFDKLDVFLPQDEKQLFDTSNPLVNSHLE